MRMQTEREALVAKVKAELENQSQGQTTALADQLKQNTAALSELRQQVDLQMSLAKRASGEIQLTHRADQVRLQKLELDMALFEKEISKLRIASASLFEQALFTEQILGDKQQTAKQVNLLPAKHLSGQDKLLKQLQEALHKCKKALSGVGSGQVGTEDFRELKLERIYVQSNDGNLTLREEL